MRLVGGGRFGTAAWAGVAGDLDELSRLQSAVKSDLSEAGFLSDPRPYQPHLTVSYRGDRAVRAALADYAGPPWTVTEFALVESRGGDYETLRAWPVHR